MLSRGICRLLAKHNYVCNVNTMTLPLPDYHTSSQHRHLDLTACKNKFSPDIMGAIRAIVVNSCTPQYALLVTIRNFVFPSGYTRLYTYKHTYASPLYTYDQKDYVILSVRNLDPTTASTQSLRVPRPPGFAVPHSVPLFN